MCASEAFKPSAVAEAHINTDLVVEQLRQPLLLHQIKRV